MTTGGTVQAEGAGRRTARHDDRNRIIARVDLVQHVPIILALIIFVGCFLRIRQRWFIRGMSGFGYDTWVVQSTIDGTAIAPNQYRPLMPWVDHLLSSATGIPLPSAILAADLLLLGVTVYMLHRLCCRLGSPALLLAAAAAWGYWVAKLDHWHPEVMLLTAIVTGVALLFVDERPRLLVVLALGLLACGARTDYALGLGIVALAVGLRRRQPRCVSVGVAVAAAAIASTILLTTVIYPDARYQVAVVQLPFNLTPGVWAMVLSFYGPVLLVPALYLLRNRSLPPMAFVIAWFACQFAATMVVGRVEESRIFMPFAAVLGVAAGAAWLAPEEHRGGASR